MCELEVVAVSLSRHGHHLFYVFKKLLSLTNEIRCNKFTWQAYTRARFTSMANRKSSDVLIEVDKLQQQQVVSIHLFSCGTGLTKKGKSKLVIPEPLNITSDDDEGESDQPGANEVSSKHHPRESALA